MHFHISFIVFSWANILLCLRTHFVEQSSRPCEEHTSLESLKSQPRNCNFKHNSFIHSFYFYSTSLSPLLLRGAPDTVRILCRNFTPKRHRQLRMKDLPKIPTWRLDLDSNLRPFA